jgi:hypothetical protein
MAAMAGAEVVGYRGTAELARWAALPGWRLRRELEYAETAGVVRVARVGHYRLVPEDQLPALRAWLERRGLWHGEANTGS